MHYARAGLTLAHYDARAHLVVARRIFDSLTPGWQQIGAVWLPLPHLLNALPVQIDLLYRTGWSGVAISLASMAVAAWAIASLVHRTTGSVTGGVVAVTILMLNPDVLYLQSTPMTEPLLFGTTFLAAALVARWLDGDPRGSTRAPGWALVAACLTRYEAWPITAALLVAALLVLLRRGFPVRDAIHATRRLAAWPFWTVIAFMVHSRLTIGEWFVSGGFFVAQNRALGHPLMAWHQVWDGLFSLTGAVLPRIAVAAALLVAAAFVRSRQRASLLTVLTLAACAALPWYAYYQGHPLRLRYDVPLVAAAAAIAGAGIAVLPRRVRAVVAVLVIAAAVWQAEPFDAKAPVITESQREARNQIGRRTVTAYLQAHWDGQPILMSMGSLAHYMQDLSYAGFAIHDFVHEGNGELWQTALISPRPFVEWIVVEEHAEGGDVLYHKDPSFFDGYDRVAEGGGVALWERKRGER